MRRGKQWMGAVAAALVMAPAAWATPDGFITDMDAAMEQAKSEQKDLLMDFTGSDWCGWCIRLKNEVFNHEEFVTAATERFVLVELDFPRSVPQSDELKAQNAHWRDRFGVRGYPTIMLTDAQGRPYARTGYRRDATDPQSYMAHLDQLRQVRVTRDAAFEKAAEAEGLDRARALDEALSTMDSGLAAVYEQEMAQIIELDANNEAGLKEKYETILAERREAQRAAQIQQELGERLSNVRTLVDAGQTDEALALVDGVLDEMEMPDTLRQQVLNIRVQIQMAAGDVEGALETMDAAIAISPRSGVGVNLNRMRRQLRAQLEQQEAQPGAAE